VPGLKPRALVVELVSERMREALNSNPLAQLGVVGVLIVIVAIFLMSSGGGEEEESAAPAEATTEAAASVAEAPTEAATEGGSLTTALSAVGQAAATAPPLPRPVLAAWDANQTLALLFVRDGGIDDRLAKDAIGVLARFPDATVFVVPAAKISRYAAITEGVGVDRVPALVVVAPKHLKKTVPTASVSYGFQSSQSIEQAVIDAGYRGKTLDYHP
jgi:hypothetical protein